MKFKSRLTKTEKEKISDIILTLSDDYGEFYLTKNNMRLYIRENLEVFFDLLKKGDKICYDTNCIAIIDGFSDNYKRHYIKFLYKNILAIDNLLQDINWNINEDLYTKIKKNNPLLQILLHHGFVQIGDRGKELLLVKYKKDK